MNITGKLKMNPFTRVNLHCHSVYSDGELTPEALADRLASAGVSFASLTDHDSVEGLSDFREKLKHHNIGFLSGVEITTQLRGREIHLLAYGFDISHVEFLSTLSFLDHARRSKTQGPLRRMPSQYLPEPKGTPAPGVAETGKIEIEEAIALTHRAGGRTFLSHPLIFESNPDALLQLFEELKNMGIDGVEGVWEQGREGERDMVHALAEKMGFVLCAGSDFHGLEDKEHAALFTDIPTDMWKRFVKLIIATPQPEASPVSSHRPAKPLLEKDDTGWPWSYLRLRIVLPSVVAILLFVSAIWGMVLPSIEDILIDRKRDMIRELTNTAISLLAEAVREEHVNQLTRMQAQEKAKAYIGALRYGKEGKDYFWIQDMHPNMIMHPYRPDLNGRDVSGVTDPTGVPIFVEFAKLVKRQKSGFVAYVWQWKDDPERLAAKESYVKGFEPWGWVIGTGIYIDDVKQEINTIERNLVYTLTAIVGMVFIVLLFNIRQSLNVEKKRREIQTSLREAEQRYRSLVEATTEGTLLVLNHRCRYGNPTFLEMTGYTTEKLELAELTDLFPLNEENTAIREYIEQIESIDSGSKSFEALLMRVNGEMNHCLVTLNPILLEEYPGIIVLLKEAYPRQREWAAEMEKLGTSLLFYSQPIGHLGTPAVSCDMDTTLHEAASMMNRGGATAIVAVSGAGEPMGLITDEDFRKHAGLSETALNATVRALTTTPLVTVSEKTLFYEALLLMEQHKVHHLAVLDTAGRIKSIVDTSELLHFYRNEPEVLFMEILSAKTVDKIKSYCRRLSGIAEMLFNAGSKPGNLARLCANMCDAATIRFIDLAIEENGPPPAPFVFVAMGSQGRQEQALLTDQDNGIIYQEDVGSDPSVLSDYFIALGSKVCGWLDQAGYLFCNGKVMANNPDWCRSLEDWKEKFSTWILESEPKDLMEFSICLDFRAVYGDADLVDALRGSFYETLKTQPSFLPRLAQNVLQFKPPPRFLGRIIKTAIPRESPGQLNIKEILMAMVGFGRLYAFHHQMAQTNTLARMDALAAKGILSRSDHDAAGMSYDFLMGLRFKAHLNKIRDGKTLDNCIDMDRIDPMDEVLLKHAFSQIEALQKKVIYDFLGGAEYPGT